LTRGNKPTPDSDLLHSTIAPSYDGGWEDEMFYLSWQMFLGSSFGIIEIAVNV
jgi:hypothetical protein